MRKISPLEENSGASTTVERCAGEGRWLKAARTYSLHKAAKAASRASDMLTANRLTETYKHAFESTAADRDRLANELASLRQAADHGALATTYKHAFESTAADRDRLAAELSSLCRTVNGAASNLDRILALLRSLSEKQGRSALLEQAPTARGGRASGAAETPAVLDGSAASFDHLIFEHGSCDTGKIRKAIFDHGCALIRGLVDEKRIEMFAMFAENTFDSCDRIARIFDVKDDEPLDEISHPGFRKFVMNRRIGQIEVPEFEFFNGGISLSDLLMTDAGTREFVQSVLGGVWFPGAMMARRVSPSKAKQSKCWQQPICMHCDGPILSKHTFSINFWVPLTDCVGTAPSLQLVPGPFAPLQELLRHDANASTVDVELQEQMERHYSSGEDGRQRFVPRLRRGDVLVFHNWIVHGTYATPDMTYDRTSFELRFNASESRQFEAFAG